MLNSSIWRAVLSLFYPPVIIRGKNGKNSENPVGSNKSEKRKPKSAVYRSFWASVVYFHLRLISTKSHKGEMTRNQFGSNPTWVRIPPAAPKEEAKKDIGQKSPVFSRLPRPVDQRIYGPHFFDISILGLRSDRTQTRILNEGAETCFWPRSWMQDPGLFL